MGTSLSCDVNRTELDFGTYSATPTTVVPKWTCGYSELVSHKTTPAAPSPKAIMKVSIIPPQSSSDQPHPSQYLPGAKGAITLFETTVGSGSLTASVRNGNKVLTNQGAGETSLPNMSCSSPALLQWGWLRNWSKTTQPTPTSPTTTAIRTSNTAGAFRTCLAIYFSLLLGCLRGLSDHQLVIRATPLLPALIN